MIGLYGIAFWLPTIVKAFGIKGYFGVGLITAIPYGVAVIGMILLSVHSDKTGERRLHYVFNVTAGAIGLLLSGIFASNPVWAIIFLSIGTLGVIGSMPLFWPLPSAFLAGTAAAAGIGIVNSVGNLGGYFGPNIPIWAKLISSNRSAALYNACSLEMVIEPFQQSAVILSIDDINILTHRVRRVEIHVVEVEALQVSGRDPKYDDRRTLVVR